MTYEFYNVFGVLVKELYSASGSGVTKLYPTELRGGDGGIVYESRNVSPPIYLCYKEEK